MLTYSTPINSVNDDEIIDLTKKHSASHDNDESDNSDSSSRPRLQTISSGSKNFERSHHNLDDNQDYEKHRNNKIKSDAFFRTFSENSADSDGSNFTCCQYLSACLGCCNTDNDPESYKNLDSYTGSNNTTK